MGMSRPKSQSDEKLKSGKLNELNLTSGYVPKNIPGISLEECPIEAYNHNVVLRLKPQQKKDSLIFIPESAAGRMNSAIVMACGGEVENAEELLGKHVVFAKFRYAEPFQFTNPDGQVHNYMILEDRDLIGYYKDQRFSAQIPVSETSIPEKPRIAKPMIQ